MVVVGRSHGDARHGLEAFLAGGKGRAGHPEVDLGTDAVVRHIDWTMAGFPAQLCEKVGGKRERKNRINVRLKWHIHSIFEICGILKI